MSLQIKITEIHNLPSSGILFIEGSRAGLLATETISGTTKFAGDGFVIKCADTDNLRLKFARDTASFMNQQYLCQGHINGPSLAKMCLTDNENANNRSKLQHLLYSSAEFQLYGNDESRVITVYSRIHYDRVTRFSGEVATNTEIRPAAVAVMRSNAVKLYKGPCPTNNLFSFLDPARGEQKFNFVESIYKDV